MKPEIKACYIVEHNQGGFLICGDGWIRWTLDPREASYRNTKDETRDMAYHWGKQLGRVRNYNTCEAEYYLRASYDRH